VNSFYKCNELTAIAIVLRYHKQWQQNDIDALTGHFFQQYPFLEKKEHSEGADIESVRFTWNNKDFTLFFECYSDSIWIDSTEGNSAKLLAKLQHKINNLKEVI